MSNTDPTLLVILDGLGISDEKKHNAFFQAYTPHLDRWKTQHAYTTLQAAGNFVGLPHGYNGNSQVGHFTLGSGKIVDQTSTLLNHAMQQHILHCSDILANQLKNFNRKRRVHLLGLASDGNIHSNLDHLRSIIYALKMHNITTILVHAFLDGRDTPPCSAEQYLDIIASDLKKYECGKIASLHGRFYAMDRNKNNDRIQKTFEILTTEQPEFVSWQQALEQSYDCKISDEFLKPIACIKDHTIKDGDGIIFLNFRPDRAIQLTEQLLQLNLSFFVTPVIYHKNLATTPLIPEVQADNCLLEILSAADKSLFTIAETEKYAHVTYFFNGHKDITIPGEQRVLIPSLTNQDMTKNPCMQAEQISQSVLHSLQNNPRDFYLINYANADMIGHSGDLPATIKAIECLDRELGKLYQQVVIKQGGTIYITADHGNAELMHDNNSNQPCTRHTNNPVPFYMLSNKETKSIDHLQGLADVASFILKNMDM